MTDKMIDVSVVIPAYNASKYIADSIHYIKDQTHANFECIIIDDGSVDDTYNVATRKINGDARFKIIKNQQNFGQAKSRNIGLDLARGRYLIWLDVDDVYHRQLIELTFKKASKSNADVTVFNADLYQTGYGSYTRKIVLENYIPNKLNFKLNETNNGQKLFRLSLFRNELWNKMYNRKYLLKNGFRLPQHLRRCDDLGLSVNTLMMAEKISFVPNSLIIYRHRLTGSNQDTSRKYPLAYLQALDIIYDYMVKNEFLDEFYDDFVFLVRHNTKYNLSISNTRTKELIKINASKYFSKFLIKNY